jgi:hypothetical protein
VGRTYLAGASAENPEARLELGLEAIGSLPAGEGEPAVLARVGTAYAAFELGDVELATRLVAEAEVKRHGLGHDALTWQVTALRAALAMFKGQLGRAEALLGTLSSLSRAVGSASDMMVARGHLQLHFEQDRMAELVPLLDAMVAGPPVPGWRSARALALAHAGRPAAARGALAELRGELGSSRHAGWLTHRTADALTAHATADAPTASDLAQMLAPYEDRLCIDVVASAGPVGDGLGVARAAAGDVAGARTTLERTAERCRRQGSPLREERARSAIASLG